ncbi:MAG: hypothetical protein HKN18_13715 [Silicimonas sp.]|nr:hypothetical protein [Silicimonas sp.]
MTAHIGNYDVVRGLLSRQGLELAALYKPQRNPTFIEILEDLIRANMDQWFWVHKC